MSILGNVDMSTNVSDASVNESMLWKRLFEPRHLGGNTQLLL